MPLAIAMANTILVPYSSSPTKIVKIKKPLEINQEVSMTASWYGFESGTLTASGQWFDPKGMTCASKTLPFFTRILLTNPTNGRSVVCVVNDRGPYVKGRQVDCSEGVAAVLGFKQQGIAKLRVKVRSEERRVGKECIYRWSR